MAHRTQAVWRMPLLVALLGALLLAPPALAAGPEARPDGAPQDPLEDGTDAVERSTQDLGDLLCAPHPSYCGDVWRLGMERGSPFNLLIAETCLWVGYRESEDAGIACAENAIRAVAALPDAALVQGQFAPGERERHVFWHHQTDGHWAQVATAYIQRIPAYCDQSTPMIYEYFPCLLREVQFFQSILKKYQRFWQAPQRS